MKQFLCFLLSFTCTLFLSAQIPAIQWQKTIGGSETGNIEGPNFISGKVSFKTKNGNTIIADTTNSNNGDIFENRGGADLFIGELDRYSTWIWRKTYGGSGNDQLVSLQPANGDDGYIILASTTSNNFQVSGNHGKSDAWVLRIDKRGELKWTKCFGGSNPDFGAYMTKAENSSYIFIGTTKSVDGDGEGIDLNPADTSDYGEIWVVRMDEAGNKLWSKTYPEYLFSFSRDIGTIIKQTSDGGFICGGLKFKNYDRSIWVAKLSSEGVLQWSKLLGGSRYEYLGDVEIDVDDGYVIVGNTESNDGDVSGSHLPVPDFNADAWIVKLSSAGALLWQKCIGGKGYDEFEDVIRTADGNYLAVGFSSEVSGDITLNFGGVDCMIAKVSATGNLIWLKTIGGTRTDIGMNVFSQSENEIFILGQTSSNDISVSDNHGSNDIWLVKLGNSSGIKGIVYYDDNSNGIKDPDEKWTDNIIVTA